MSPTRRSTTRDGTKSNTGAARPPNIGRSMPIPAVPPRRTEAMRTRRLTGCVRIATAIPASEPNVPGDLGMSPTPSALAIASAMRGFLRGVSGATVALVFVVIGVGQIENDRLALAFSVLFLVVDRCAITFIKDRIGDHVLFAGPVAQVPKTAALAAEGKIRVYRCIGRRLANRKFVLHGRFVSRV